MTNAQQILSLYNLTGSYAGVLRFLDVSDKEIKQVIAENPITPSKKAKLSYEGPVPEERDKRIYITDEELKRLFLKVMSKDGQL